MSINMPEAREIYKKLPAETIAELSSQVKLPSGLRGSDERRLMVIRHIADHIVEFRTTF